MASRELRDRVNESCNENFTSYTKDQLEEEIVRQFKLKMDHEESKKAYAKSYTELIGEAEVTMQYCVERIDHIQHEAAVEAHLNENV